MNSKPIAVLRFLALLATVALVAACQVPSTKSYPAAQLQLLEAAPLDVPRDCTASGSFHVAFTVSASGRTRDIRPPDAPDCIQQALTAWIESFRYAPTRADTPTAVEWMLVSAKRGT